MTFPICTLFNVSLRSGTFPDLWKQSYVLPFFKSGDINNVGNYRPISKLNSIAQVLDSLVHTKLSEVFTPFISSQQHGFVKGKSTVTNLMDLTEKAFSAFSRRSQLDAIYTDFSKAFDKVIHAILIYKLKCSGISGTLLRWITSYLLNRTQMVFLRNAKSRMFLAPSGVPQGSHLGPLLFILFINDLPAYLDSDLGLLMFADDCKMFHLIESMADCRHLQENLNKFMDYCTMFGLRINLDKCQKITFGRNVVGKIQHNYHLGNHTLDEVSVVKDLGVMLDSKLTFDIHIDHIYNKSLRMLGFVFRTCKPFTNLNAVKTVYFAFVRSHLEYCSPVWNPRMVKHSTLLEKIQRKFMRYLYNKRLILAGSEFHYRPALTELNLRTLESRRRVSDIHHLLGVAFGNIQGLYLEEYTRSLTSERVLRSQRILTPIMSCQSNINRCVESLNSLTLITNPLLCSSLSIAKSLISEAVPFS